MTTPQLTFSHLGLYVKYIDLMQSSYTSEVHQVNHGMAWSLYFLDPEGNRIELFTNSPWHVQQPISDQLNLNLSDQVIVQTTKDKYYNYAGFQNRSEWQKKLLPTLRS